MRDAIFTYFAAERAGGQILAIAGVVFLLASFAIWARAGRWRHGAIPLGLVACIEIAAGSILALRTDGQVGALLDQLADNPALFKVAEMERMVGVMDTFRILTAAETTIAVIGLGLVARGLFRGLRPAWVSVGAALLLQATFTLGFDGAAAERAARYAEALDAFEPPELSLEATFQPPGEDPPPGDAPAERPAADGAPPATAAPP